MKNFIQRNHYYIYVVISLILALAIRIPFFRFESGDYRNDLTHWFDQVVANGGVLSWGTPIGNYTPFYCYLISFFSYLPFPKIVCIKLISVSFDFIAAFWVKKIVFELTGLERKSSIAGLIFLFYPILILNGSMWGQCDIIYTSFLLMFGFYILKEDYFRAMIGFGFAFAIKMQAVWVFPFLVLLWLKDKIKLTHFLIIPGVYLLTIIPSFLMGRSLTNLLLIYWNQFRTHGGMSMNAPNLYNWVPVFHNKSVLFSGLILAIFSVLSFFYYFYLKIDNNLKKVSIYVITFCYSFIPWILPKMHDRYFFPAEVFIFILAMKDKKFIPVLILLMMASYTSYSKTVGPEDFFISPSIASIFPLIAFVFIFREIYLNLKENNNL